jgi:hypothetical protein
MLLAELEHVDTLDNKSQELLEAIRARGVGWHTRAEIAAQLGKNKLNPVEAALLDAMAARGVLEREMQPSNKPHIQHWAYRIKE